MGPVVVAGEIIDYVSFIRRGLVRLKDDCLVKLRERQCMFRPRTGLKVWARDLVYDVEGDLHADQFVLRTVDRFENELELLSETWTDETFMGWLDIEHPWQRWIRLRLYRRLKRLDIRRKSGARRLPGGIRAHQIRAEGSLIETVGERVHAFDIDLSRTRIRSLPPSTRADLLDLHECTQLTTLPALRLELLDCTGCVALRSLPDGLQVRRGLALGGCAQLSRLPSLPPVGALSVEDCPLITELPSDLVVEDVLELGGSGVRRLPAGVQRAQILWHGTALARPEVLEAQDPSMIASSTNEHERETMLEIVGLERFADYSRSTSRLLDEDTDPGGQRRLFAAAIRPNHWVYWLEAHCPSTGHRHLLRVPPYIADCGEAAAWLAGARERRVEFEVET